MIKSSKPSVVFHLVQGELVTLQWFFEVQPEMQVLTFDGLLLDATHASRQLLYCWILSHCSQQTVHPAERMVLLDYLEVSF